MKPPDRDEFQGKLNAIQEEIDKLQTKKKEINDQISAQSGGRDDFFQERNRIKSQLDEINEQLAKFEGKKEAINDNIGKQKQEKTDALNQINKMKRTIGYDSEASIDDRIATIEFKLWTESITLKEEKKYLQEIAELKRNRPKVSQVASLEEGLKSRSDAGQSKEELNQIGADMFALRERRREISKQLKELVESRSNDLNGFKEKQEEREKLNEKIKGKIEEKNKLRDEFREEENKYRDYQAAERQKRMDKLKEERMRIDAEKSQRAKQARADKLDEQPHLEEITLIEQTIAFCKSLVQDKGPVQKEEKESKDLNVFEGAEVLVKKEDREEFYFAPTGKSKKKGGKKNKEGGSSKPIKHNAETFRLFDKLKLEAPITTDDVPAKLEQLEAQLADFQLKVKDWERTRDEKKAKILAGEEEDEPEEKAEPAKDEKADGEDNQKEEGGDDAAEEGKAED